MLSVCAGIDVRGALAAFRNGRRDPTTQIGSGDFWRATRTPDGPGTLRIRWDGGGAVDAQAWGAGASWLLQRVPHMTGVLDPGTSFPEHAHAAVRRAHHNHPGHRIGASGTLYHDLLPVILAQRVTGIEAVRQWERLVLRLGEPAPGPRRDLRLPPAPELLASKPAWWFHPFGVEAKRAEALRTVARHASRIDEWGGLAAADAAAKLALLPGIGVWTINEALATCFGDPDAVPVGDYHVKNVVSWALAGEARGTDERMLELLEPFRGQRGRVIALLGRDGWSAPKFGPRQRIQPMYRY